jgi:gamma-glutamylcyclotransferase (GGCT)/AIG2-like uncharacterized protein YtfP
MWGLKKFAVPGLKWINDVHARTKFTPDLLEIESTETQLLFVYNELMAGRSKYLELMGLHAHLEATAYTQEPNWVLWKKDLGALSFPIALPGVDHGKVHLQKQHIQLPFPTRGTASKIKGELYSIASTSIKEIDNYMLNGVQFQRKKIRLVIPYHEIEIGEERDDNGSVCSYHNTPKAYIVRAWFYEGRPEHWDPILDYGYSSRIVGLYPSEKTYLNNHYYYSLGEHEGRNL